MKIIYFLMIILCLFYGCASSNSHQLVGSDIDNQYFISQNLEPIREECNKILKENSIAGRVKYFKILKNWDTNENAKEYFSLVGYSQDSSATIATSLLMRKRKFYFQDYKEQRVIVCHGSTNCIPQKFKNDSWGCDCDESHLFDCKKIETIIVRN
jgi:hypothetical protein